MRTCLRISGVFNILLQVMNHGTEVMLRIVDKFLSELRGQLAAKAVELEASPEARALLAERGHDPAFGARPLARVIDSALKRLLTDELLFGRLRDGGRVAVGVQDGELDLRIEP